MRAHRRLLVASIVGAIATSGCAGTSVLPGHGHGEARSRAGSSNRSTVIKGWSNALRTGQYGRPPRTSRSRACSSTGPGTTSCSTAWRRRSHQPASAVRRQICLGDQARPLRQRAVQADRPLGAGWRDTRLRRRRRTTARVNFIIEDGKITHWLRAPSLPGDNPTNRPAPAARFFGS